MLMIVTLSLAGAALAALAITLGWTLGWANRAFAVEVDPKVTAILEKLPGSNCGGCGYAGCGDYAEAVAAARAPLNLCSPGGAACATELAAIVGVAVGEVWPYRAVVHCAATLEQRLQRREYEGEPTCAAANLVAGVQGCVYGCLGLGDCVRACDYDAIHIVDGLARVDYEKCIGCKACATACPRNIITMVPFKAERVLVVACSNADFGLEVKAVCEVGCIGCKACSRHSNLFVMQGNLPALDYERYTPEADVAAALEKCPMESLVYVGKPSPADLAAVASESLPDRVTADFKTTVDETEWRG